MTGIIIAGHGKFASGLQSSIELIVGKQDKVAYVDFLADHSTEDLEKNIKEAVAELGEGEGILFLTDLVGGSPFKVSALISKDLQQSGVVTGTNLPMVMDIVLSRGEQTAKELMDKAFQSGKDGIKTFAVN